MVDNTIHGYVMPFSVTCGSI